jgi:RNA polymerase sigma factor (sigma-70 family)
MSTVKAIHTTSLTDTELVQLYQQNGDQETLASLFMRYYELVYGTCVKYLSDQEAARDATMNIYHELLEKVKRHTIENFKSWLYTLSKNHCLMVLRKQKRMPQVPFENEYMQSEDFSHLDSVMEKEQRLQLLEYCIGTLNADQKNTVHLFYLENKCYNEICDATGYDWNKVRSLIQNGRRNLKICMEENG